MSHHLHECFVVPPASQPICICDQLRACEERVLNAARDAVAAAPVAIREPEVILLNRGVALAAIDALRGEV